MIVQGLTRSAWVWRFFICYDVLNCAGFNGFEDYVKQGLVLFCCVDSVIKMSQQSLTEEFKRDRKDKMFV